ncbi:HlyD family efflux transporter periplasmic adaptor subunit [Lachnoclostridium sp. An118]|uniref:HlyD family efflux transporter periplasmic adaptor subunit n=1 Tax=Lachnoclostridium sp. An118 TaxID=1965547 RepID=UPI000B3875AE|nr:HlyD family efflux transporter periplasmic adaptor subunit [Lachnoclostridium sp. An118]OUQ50760.1 hypothetical protein B5E62_07030 [Lachnoclostridium sp. An118]
MSGKAQGNIQVYRKKWNFNIGIVIFGVILIYLVVTVLTYATAKHVTAYEVREGSIFRDTAYTGLVLRQETVVNAEADGYINYFVPEGSKVGRKTNVYSISSEKLDFSSSGQEDAEQEQSVSSEEQQMILQQTQSFSDSFQDSRFEEVYTFKDSVENILSSSSSQSRQSQLAALIQSGAEGVTAYPAADDGVIVYSVDGYEGLTADQVTADMLSRADYKSTELSDNAKVKAGDAAYKLVTDESWSLVIVLDADMAQELAETATVQVRFSKDGETASGSLSIYNTEDEDVNLGYITFNESMVRYAGERFLDIQLVLEDESGLKIPKSSVVEKEFYTVPQDYITQGGDSSQNGVLVQTDENTTTFEAAEVYYRDNETGLVYLDADAFKEGTVLVKPDSSETCTLGEKGTLQGVFNINKGYAEFTQVEILCENEEYYIVQSGNDYGLANYDHIALDGSDIHENEIIF